MNAELFLDALALMPDDLIAEVDARRQSAKKPIPFTKSVPFKRLAPLAACLALVLMAATMVLPMLNRQNVEPAETIHSIHNSPPAVAAKPGQPEAQEATGAPLAPNTVSKDGQEIREIPVTARTFSMGDNVPAGILMEIISSRTLLESSLLFPEDADMESYDEAWFRENQLLLLLTDPASSSIRYDVRAIRQLDTGSWELTGNRIVPQWQTEDMSHQLILVELPRMVEPEDTVALNLTPVKE